MRTGGGAQAVGQHDRAGDTGAETDAVICPRHVIVHRFWDGDYFDPFLVQADPIAQRVVAADWDEIINPSQFKFVRTSSESDR